MPLIFLPSSGFSASFMIGTAGLDVETLASRSGCRICRRNRSARSARSITNMKPSRPGCTSTCRRLAVDRQVEQQVLVDLVIVVEIVRIELVGPHRLAGIGIAREDGGRPFVVAFALVGIPRAGIAGAVEDQIGLRDRS